MSRLLLLQELGQFIISFQALEQSISDLVVQIVQPDPEYAATLTAELEFRSKVRALDVVFARFAQIHGLSTVAPHPDFHKLMSKILRAAERRNQFVHSHYATLQLVNGSIGLVRTPTMLKPSKGERSDPNEDIMLNDLKNDVAIVQSLQIELGAFREQVINVLHGAA